MLNQVLLLSASLGIQNTRVAVIVVLHCGSPKCDRKQCSPGLQVLCVLYLHYNVANDMEIPGTNRFITKGFEMVQH